MGLLTNLFFKNISQIDTDEGLGVNLQNLKRNWGGEKKTSARRNPNISGTLRNRWNSIKQNLSRHGEKVGTGHKRILIPKEALSRGDLTRLGFQSTYIAIPEAGQVAFASFRHPNQPYHIHDHGKNWTLHKDEHMASTMAVAKLKQEGKTVTPGRQVWESIKGLPHLIGEGLPGLFYYMRGQFTSQETMGERLTRSLSSEYKGIMRRWSGFDDEYNTISGMRHGGAAGRNRKHNTDFGSGYQGLKKPGVFQHTKAASGFYPDEYSMLLQEDEFVHFTTPARAQEIVKSNKLMFHPPYKQMGISGAFAVSTQWGQSVPGVQSTHAGKLDELAAVVFKTDTMSAGMHHVEEVRWDQDVHFTQSRIVTGPEGAKLLNKTPYRGLGSLDDPDYMVRHTKSKPAIGTARGGLLAALNARAEVKTTLPPPARVIAGKGVARGKWLLAGGIATGLVGAGVYFFSGKDDAYNTIEGLPHGGVGQQKRRELTDFGSGFIGKQSLYRGTLGEFVSHSPRGLRGPAETLLEKVRAAAYPAATKRSEVTFWTTRRDWAQTHAMRAAGSLPDPDAVIESQMFMSRVHVDPGQVTLRSDALHKEISNAIVDNPGRAEELAHLYWQGKNVAGKTVQATDEAVEVLLPGTTTSDVTWNVIPGFETKYKPSTVRGMPFQDWTQSRFSGFDDAHNTIEGLRHGGIAPDLRKRLTKFGSGFDRARGIAEGLGMTYEALLKSSMFEHALKTAKLDKKLGEGVAGIAYEMKTQLGGEEFSFVMKELRPFEDTVQMLKTNTIKARPSAADYPMKVFEDAAANMRDLRKEGDVLFGLRDTPMAPTGYGLLRDAEGQAQVLMMEAMPGKPMKDMQKFVESLTSEGRMEGATELMEQMSVTANEAIKQGWINRDIHTGNILLDEATGRFSWIDWGAAESIGSSVSGLKHAMAQREMAPGIEQMAANIAGQRMSAGAFENIVASKAPVLQNVPIGMSKYAEGSFMDFGDLNLGATPVTNPQALMSGTPAGKHEALAVSGTPVAQHQALPSGTPVAQHQAMSAGTPVAQHQELAQSVKQAQGFGTTALAPPAGLGETGLAATVRKSGTDFGSPYRGLAASVSKKLTKDSTAKTALLYSAPELRAAQEKIWHCAIRGGRYHNRKSRGFVTQLSRFGGGV